jgi:beta-glucanase (GH16 family)
MNVNASVGTINGRPTPKVFYNTTFAAGFHTYKLVWTPTSVAWLVDKGASHTAVLVYA